MTKKRRKKAAGCFPQCHYQYSREFVDYDYVDKLSDEEAEFLANFSDNYYSGRFRKDDDVNPIKNRKEGYNRARKQRFDIMSGRSKSRIVLNEDGSKYINSVDLDIFKKYVEDGNIVDKGESDEDN